MDPTMTCRVFISRNSRDREVSDTIREKLERVAGNLEFFDDGDISPGDNWRMKLRQELKKANLLLLILTKPSVDDFDWPLYEAGLFESLDTADRRRVVCIYPDPDLLPLSKCKSSQGLPSQLADIQGVEATEDDLLEFLRRLFTDKDFTNTVQPLHRRVSVNEDLRPLALEFANAINRVPIEPVEPTSIKYVNYFIKILLPHDARSLGPDIEIESNESSMRHLFGLLDESPRSGRRWTWGEATENPEATGQSADFNRRWTTQLEKAISAMKGGRYFRQLSSMFLAADGRFYKPAIEIYRRFGDGSMTIDVCFWEQAQDAWLQTARPPVALAAHLELASRIRYELIEPYLRRISYWRTKKAKSNGCAELSAAIGKIEHYMRFIEQLTGSNLEEAFTSEEAEKLEKLKGHLDAEVKTELTEALQSQRVPKLRKALQLWQRNNLRFLGIGLTRYQELLGLQEDARR